MSRNCGNCDSKISDSGFFVNRLMDAKKLNRINKALGVNLPEVCEKCGPDLLNQSGNLIRSQLESCRGQLEDQLVDFPMFTVGSLPAECRYFLLGMITANVTVGTGFLNEWMQSFQDSFGVTATDSGMALKSNKGEMVARRIMIAKAEKLGANAIMGVDLDYGVTGNNAAVINMQGTAVKIESISSIFPPGHFDGRPNLSALKMRIQELEDLL